MDIILFILCSILGYMLAAIGYEVYKTEKVAKENRKKYGNTIDK